MDWHLDAGKCACLPTKPFSPHTGLAPCEVNHGSRDHYRRSLKKNGNSDLTKVFYENSSNICGMAMLSWIKLNAEQAIVTILKINNECSLYESNILTSTCGMVCGTNVEPITCIVQIQSISRWFPNRYRCTLVDWVRVGVPWENLAKDPNPKTATYKTASTYVHKRADTWVFIPYSYYFFELHNNCQSSGHCIETRYHNSEYFSLVYIVAGLPHALCSVYLCCYCDLWENELVNVVAFTYTIMICP